MAYRSYRSYTGEYPEKYTGIPTPSNELNVIATLAPKSWHSQVKGQWQLPFAQASGKRRKWSKSWFTERTQSKGQGKGRELQNPISSHVQMGTSISFSGCSDRRAFNWYCCVEQSYLNKDYKSPVVFFIFCKELWVVIQRTETGGKKISTFYSL